MTRQWQSSPKLFEDPREVDTYYASAMRNDGQMFMVHVTRGLGISDAHFTQQTFQRLDTFLDPNCQCVVGHNCEMHKDLKVGPLVLGQNV